MAQQPTSHGAHGHSDSHESHGSLKSYVIGFVLSIVLTIIPLVAILQDLVKGTAATVVLLVTAVLQFVVQLFFFMHLKEEKGTRWNLMALIVGIITILMIVLGSVWIMNYNLVMK